MRCRGNRIRRPAPRGHCGDGLEIVRKLLRQARTRLQPQGIVVLEVGGLREAIDREFAALEPHWLHTADGADCVVLFQAARLK